MYPELDKKLRAVAQQMQYPPTPVIDVLRHTSKSRIQRRYVWQIAVLILIVLASLLMWQPVRAKVGEWLGLSSLQVVPASQAPSADIALIEAMTRSQQTTLATAQTQVSFSLRYPTELGLPDEVYVQDDELNVGVIMVWRDADQQIRYALYQLVASQGFYKGLDFIEMTRVVETPNVALWLAQPHTFWFNGATGREGQEAYLIEQPALVWEYNGILHRFESNLTMEEAVAIANSMTAIE